MVGLASCSKKEEPPPDEPVNLVADTSTSLAGVVDTTTFTVTDSTITLKQSDFLRPQGRVVNIMVTGVDSRLSDYGAHADANHLVRFFIDSGMVEIISIPRDTPSDAGFEDSTGLNKLTNVRAAKGRTAYLQAVSEITGVYPIQYWVEFGFSQAIGLLELLGYKDNASSTLHVLRSRQAYRAGDFQRSYNQGRFIRAALLKQLPSGTDLVHGLMLRAGLAMVETNVTYDVSSTIAEQMVEHGFTGQPERAWVRLMPPVLLRVQAVEFDSANIRSLDSTIIQKVAPLLKDSSRITSERYENQLVRLLGKADSTTKAASIIRLLKRPFDQRAWLQVTNRTKRVAYRDKLCGKLEQAYRKVGNVRAANGVHDYVNQERAAFGY